MIKVVEAFSGLGSQAKALKNINVPFKVLKTIDWDINAIYAYDIIHNGKQNLEEYESINKEDLIKKLSRYSLSANGKTLLEYNSLKNMREETLRRLYAAIKRSNNLVNIQNVVPDDFDEDIDIFTYSFPCQDLSVSGFWHGNKGGIDRNAGNRSSMLWEVERLLLEMEQTNKNLPKFLVMENVTAIRSNRHIDNFNEWQDVLEDLGYVNQVYNLSAYNFGVPQNRTRTFMISVYVGRQAAVKEIIEDYFKKNNLEINSHLYKKEKNIKVEDLLRQDYSNMQYYEEAVYSTPNNTKSREKIYEKNPRVYNLEKNHYRSIVRTITTKQDRHPNSGVIDHKLKLDKKSEFRYLTPRECFLFMGFTENDFQKLVDNNFYSRKNTNYLTRDKLIKLAGNSIVIPILESVFLQILDIKDLLSKLETSNEDVMF